MSLSFIGSSNAEPPFFAFQNAEEQYKRTCKKFGQSSKVWTLFSEHHLQQGNIEESRKLLPRSLQSLDKRKRTSTECILCVYVRLILMNV